MKITVILLDNIVIRLLNLISIICLTAALTGCIFASGIPWWFISLGCVLWIGNVVTMVVFLYD